MKLKINILSILLVSLFVTTCAQTEEITLEKIWKEYTFYPAYVRGFASMPNGDYYTVQNDTAILKYSFQTGKEVGIILNNEDIRKVAPKKISLRSFSDYEFDNSESKILFSSKTEYIYRRSSKSFYYVYDLNSQKLYSISPEAKVSYAAFSNDGSKIAFVRDNNLFYYDLATEKEVQITTDGLQNNIINGFADWVHEEELEMTRCFWWSPDDQKIAFLRFDESEVKEYSMTIWGKLYPEEYKYKYPKAGEDNAVVTLHLYDIQSQKTQPVTFEGEQDCYYPRLYWLSNAKEFITLKMNRLQNKINFYKYNTETETNELVYTDSNKSWIEVTSNYYFLDNNRQMILTSEKSGFNHIYLVDFNGTEIQLTQGNYEVYSIVSVDLEKKEIYYLSNESDVMNCDLYCINFKGKMKKAMLTDGLGWNAPEFSANSHYYLNSYSNSNTPPVYTICNNSGKVLYTLEDNARFKEQIKEYGFSPKEHFNFTTSEGVSLYGWMIKPRNFNPENKYPVLIYVYGGPSSQEVNNSYFRSNDHAWYQMLAQKGYIVVCVDGRGTLGRGNDFKTSIYKQMGKLETIDQIETAKYLKSLSYIDGERIGIWGWSFGGYLSSLAMFKGEGIFKMAIAVAPVTNWRYYDNIYTERFLRTPQENPEGYDDNSPCFFADQLDGKFLLIHGTADDNVHFQNSMDLVTRLNIAEKQYEQFFYPNKNHSIYGQNTRFHLYTKLTDFILKNL